VGRDIVSTNVPEQHQTRQGQGSSSTQWV
jgi:hypothetical protein